MSLYDSSYDDYSLEEQERRNQSTLEQNRIEALNALMSEIHYQPLSAMANINASPIDLLPPANIIVDEAKSNFISLVGASMFEEARKGRTIFTVRSADWGVADEHLADLATSLDFFGYDGYSYIDPNTGSISLTFYPKKLHYTVPLY